MPDSDNLHFLHPKAKVSSAFPLRLPSLAPSRMLLAASRAYSQGLPEGRKKKNGKGVQNEKDSDLEDKRWRLGVHNGVKP